MKLTPLINVIPLVSVINSVKSIILKNVQLQNLRSDLCLSVSSDLKLVLEICVDTNANQKFTFHEENHQFTNSFTNTCVSMTQTARLSQEISLEPCEPSENTQKWKFQKQSQDLYRIAAVKPHHAREVCIDSQGSDGKGRLINWDCEMFNDQLYKVIEIEEELPVAPLIDESERAKLENVRNWFGNIFGKVSTTTLPPTTTSTTTMKTIPVLNEYDENGIGAKIFEVLEDGPFSEPFNKIVNDAMEKLKQINKNKGPTDDSKPQLRQTPKGPDKFTHHTFTNCGKIGATGPSYLDCFSVYSKNSEFAWAKDPDLYKINQEGYQEWKVQTTGVYNVIASGAQGGKMGSSWTIHGMSYPGNGAIISADFELKEGEIIYIAVGQIGMTIEGGGGGGGTFVVKKRHGSDFSQAKEEDILLIAAGGAGSPCDGQYGKGGHGQSTRHSKLKGTGGSGLEYYYKKINANEEAAGGGGFYQDGAKSRRCDGGQSFTTGLKGGLGVGYSGTQLCQTAGGFGGGGGQISDGSGGAGGWVGGNGNPGPRHSGKNKAWSYINGSAFNVKRNSGSNKRHGSVVIKLKLDNYAELGTK